MHSVFRGTVFCFLMFFLSSCTSSFLGFDKSSFNVVENTYNIISIDKLSGASDENYIFTIEHLSGDNLVTASDFDLATNGSLSCSDKSLSKEGGYYKLMVSSCTGSGRLKIDHNSSDNTKSALISDNKSMILKDVINIFRHPNNKKLYVMNNKTMYSRSIFRIDEESGEKTIVSSNSLNPSTPLIESHAYPTAHSSDTEIFLVASDEIISVNVESGVRSVVSSDSVGSGASLASIKGLATDGTSIFAISASADTLYMIDKANGNRSVLSSSMVGAGEFFSSPVNMVLDDLNDTFYVLENTYILGVDKANGQRVRISGNSTGSGESYVKLKQAQLSSDANYLYVLDHGDSNNIDYSSNKILKVNVNTGDREVIVNNSTISSSSISSFVYNGDSSLTLFDSQSEKIIQYNYETDTQNVIANNFRAGSGETFNLSSYRGSWIATDPSTDGLYVLQNSDMKIFKAAKTSGDRTLVNQMLNVMFPVYDPQGLAIDSSGSFAYFTCDSTNGLMKIDLSQTDLSYNYELVTQDNTNLSWPTAVVLNSDGTSAFVSDTGSDQIYEVNVSDGSKVLVSNSGTGTGTMFGAPAGLALDQLEQNLYLSDSTMNAIFKIDISTGNRVIISDNSSFGSGADLDTPKEIALSSDGNFYVLNNKNLLLVNTTTGNRSVVSSDDVGSGPEFPINSSLALSNDKTKAYITDKAAAAIIEVDLSTGNRTIISR